MNANVSTGPTEVDRALTFRLAAMGRLFKEVGDGRLAIAEPVDVYNALELGDGRLHSATRLASHETGESSSSASTYDHMGFSSVDYSHSASRSSTASQEVDYQTCPVGSWEDLQWVDVRQGGLDGATVLPHAGRGRAVVSREQSQSWSRYAHSWNDGMFHSYSTRSSAGGSSYDTYRASR